MDFVNFTENPQPMFIADFKEYIKLYVGIVNAWIAELNNPEKPGTPGDLYVEYVDGAIQDLGPVSDYYAAVAEGFNGTFAEWVATLLNKKDKQSPKTSPTASGTANAFIDTITQNANGEITATKKTVAVTNGTNPLAWDTDVVVGTVAGTNITAKLPPFPDTDVLVRQNASTVNAAYEILFSETADNQNRVEGAKKTSTLTYNPSTKALSTGGTVNGYSLNAASAKQVASSISVDDTSTNLPTAKAVADFVKGNYKGTVTSVGTGVGLTGGPITTTGTISLKLKDDTYSTQTAGNPTATAGRQYPVVPDSAGNLSVNVPWTDTKVTSAANHYTPTEASGSDKSASASGATAAWSIDVVKGITLKTDGKGHVTSVAVTSGKIPANPNTDTKVTSAANHYSPSRDTGADVSASASGATAAWSIDVVKGITLQTDGKGHVTGMTVTSGKIPAQPTAYSLPLAASGTRGGVQIGFTKDATNHNYPVALSSSEKMYVNIPKVSKTEDGLCPALPNETATTKFLCQNGTWAVPTGTTYSFTDNNPTLAWGTKSKVATVGGVDIHVTMPANPNTTYSAGTGLSLSSNQFSVNFGTSGTTVAYGNHTHALTLAAGTAPSGTSTVNLSANTSYKLTAGGKDIYLKTPADTTYTSKTAASGGTDVSLCTTGEKYTWNSKTSNTGTVTQIVAGTGLSGGTITTSGTISLSAATTTAIGGIQLGYSPNGKNYAVQTSSNKAYVNVPWENTTYTAGTGLSLSNGAFSVKTGYNSSYPNYKVNADSSGNLYVSVPFGVYTAGVGIQITGGSSSNVVSIDPNAHIMHTYIANKGTTIQIPTSLTQGRVFIIIGTAQGYGTCYKYGTGSAAVIAGAAKVLTDTETEVTVNERNGEDVIRIIAPTSRHAYVSIIPALMVPNTEAATVITPSA